MSEVYITADQLQKLEEGGSITVPEISGYKKGAKFCIYYNRNTVYVQVTSQGSSKKRLEVELQNKVLWNDYNPERPRKIEI